LIEILNKEDEKIWIFTTAVYTGAVRKMQEKSIIFYSQKTNTNFPSRVEIFGVLICS
jgi:hypothetical protein